MLFFLLAGFNTILKIINHFKAKPPVHEQYVNKEHCKEVRQSCSETINRRLTGIEAELGELDKGDRKGRSDIHRDVRALEDRVAKLEGYSETMNQRQISQGGVLDKILHELGEVKGRLTAKS